MTGPLRLVPAADDFATDVVPIARGADDTVEIPIPRLLPPVAPARPRAHRARQAPRSGWLIGLVLASALVTLPLLVKLLTEVGGPLLVAAVGWAVFSPPVAFVIGRAIRMAAGRTDVSR